MTLKIAFVFHPRLTAPKTIEAEEWRIWRSTLGLYTVSEVSGLFINFLLSFVAFEHATTNDQKYIWWPILFDKGCIETSGGEKYVDAAARQRGPELTAEAIVSVDGTW